MYKVYTDSTDSMTVISICGLTLIILLHTVSVSIVAGSLLVEGTTCWGIVIRLDLSPGGTLCTVALHIGQKLRCFNHCSKQL